LAQDPYQELGVSRGASPAEIKKAFHKLAKQHHPDANPGNAASEEKFKRASSAFDLLSDADKRRKFDAGEIDADGREISRGYSGSPFTAGAGGGGRGGFASRGQDVRARLEIDLEEAILGAKRRIAFTDGRTLDVAIPKGAIDGQVLRLKGQGSPGRAGAGDALIELIIRPHAVFRREGENLVMDLPVSAPDAILGGKVQAPTPEGPVTLSVPAGSNSGTVLRLKKRGLADAHGHRGDLLARLVVTLPEGPDPALEAFARTWRQERPYSPRARA